MVIIELANNNAGSFFEYLRTYPFALTLSSSGESARLRCPVLRLNINHHFALDSRLRGNDRKCVSPKQEGAYVRSPIYLKIKELTRAGFFFSDCGNIQLADSKDG